MRYIKTDGISIFITLFAAVMGVAGLAIGVQAMIDPSTAIDFVDGADKMGIAWGGRNAGLGVIMLGAILLRSAHAYAAGFAAVMFREGSDLIAGLSEGGTFGGPSVVIVVMLALELLCLGICLRQVLSARSQIV